MKYNSKKDTIKHKERVRQLLSAIADKLKDCTLKKGLYSVEVTKLIK